MKTQKSKNVALCALLSLTAIFFSNPAQAMYPNSRYEMEEEEIQTVQHAPGWKGKEKATESEIHPATPSSVTVNKFADTVNKLVNILERAQVRSDGNQMEDGHETTYHAIDSDLTKLMYETCPPEAKQIIATLKNPRLEKQFPVKTILLVGPSGTGKSTLAKAIAQLSGRKWVFLPTVFLGNEYQKSSEKNLRKKVEEIVEKIKTQNTKKTATEQPERYVIIIDDAQDLNAPKEGRNPDHGIALALWELMDEYKDNPNIVFVGTTNDEKDLPGQLRRRMSIITVPLPDFDRRAKIIRYYRNKLQKQLAATSQENDNPQEESAITLSKDCDAFFKTLADRTEGFAGCYLEKIFSQVGWYMCGRIEKELEKRQKTNENDDVADLKTRAGIIATMLYPGILLKNGLCAVWKKMPNLYSNKQPPIKEEITREDFEQILKAIQKEVKENKEPVWYQKWEDGWQSVLSFAWRDVALPIGLFSINVYLQNRAQNKQMAFQKAQQKESLLAQVCMHLHSYSLQHKAYVGQILGLKMQLLGLGYQDEGIKSQRDANTLAHKTFQEQQDQFDYNRTVAMLTHISHIQDARAARGGADCDCSSCSEEALNCPLVALEQKFPGNRRMFGKAIKEPSPVMQIKPPFKENGLFSETSYPPWRYFPDNFRNMPSKECGKI